MPRRTTAPRCRRSRLGLDLCRTRAGPRPIQTAREAVRDALRCSAWGARHVGQEMQPPKPSACNAAAAPRCRAWAAVRPARRRPRGASAASRWCVTAIRATSAGTSTPPRSNSAQSPPAAWRCRPARRCAAAASSGAMLQRRALQRAQRLPMKSTPAQSKTMRSHAASGHRRPGGQRQTGRLYSLPARLGLGCDGRRSRPARCPGQLWKPAGRATNSLAGCSYSCAACRPAPPAGMSSRRSGRSPPAPRSGRA